MSTYVPPAKNAATVEAAENTNSYTPANPPTRLSPFISWMTDAKRAAYSSSALRILYGLALLMYFVSSYKDRHYVWGVGSSWVDSQVNRQGWPTIFGVLFPKDSVAIFDTQYLIFLALIVLFIAGWRTKFVTPVLAFFYVSLVTNSTVLTNGGDTIVRITLVFLIFADLSQHWSLDALRKRRQIRNNPALLPRIPAWFSNPLHNAAIILCGYQIMVVYVASGIYKSLGAEWMNGTALYYSMILDVFNVQPLLSQIVWQSSLFVAIGTFLSIWVQLLFPLMVLWRPTRIVALVFLLGMHFGIGLFLGLWPFSIPMMALDLLFIRDSSWQAAIKWLTNLGGNLKQFGKSMTAPHTK
ncbi:HTTM domain-containing protein [Jonesiaceae bacterium BS-20]|uniref:HTTM domain-containing protein n=1 Tax=Jonesiaceae bacterium BS-20 TaxID=3120821 RepID=A0AAU7DXX0_9MICO